MKKFLKNKFLWAFAAVLVLFIFGFLLVPNVKTLDTCFTTKMFQVEVCPKKSSYTKLSAISPYLRNAVIVAEDGSFYGHHGFDWFELKASIRSNFRAGKIKRGGSTITQQLAKNAFLNQDKSFFRKIIEAYLTFEIESVYSKDFILEKYLNMVEFGPKIYGIRAASQRYFGKLPSQLNPLEAVYLAHLLPNPKVYSQGFHRGHLTPHSQKMVQILLKRLVQYGKITGPQYQFAMSQVPYFPWSHLSMSSFENLHELEDQQQDALNKLLEEGLSEEEFDIPQDTTSGSPADEEPEYEDYEIPR